MHSQTKATPNPQVLIVPCIQFRGLLKLTSDYPKVEIEIEEQCIKLQNVLPG